MSSTHTARPLSDADIVALYFARDEQAIRRTDEKYGSFCHRLAMHILHSEQDAEECVSDTYLKTWNSIPPMRPRVLGAFLCRIVRNLAIDRIRARERRGWGQDITVALEELEETILELAETIWVPDSAEGELKDLLSDFLRKLPDGERRLFMGRYWHGYPVKELARGHGMTANAVSLRLHKTREKLRIYLNERGYRL